MVRYQIEAIFKKLAFSISMLWQLTVFVDPQVTGIVYGNPGWSEADGGMLRLWLPLPLPDTSQAPISLRNLPLSSLPQVPHPNHLHCLIDRAWDPPPPPPPTHTHTHTHRGEAPRSTLPVPGVTVHVPTVALMLQSIYGLTMQESA